MCLRFQDVLTLWYVCNTKIYVGKILPLRVTGLGLRFKGLIEVGGK